MLPQRGTVTAPPAPVISGMLKKRGKERLSLWRMRWFSLEKVRNSMGAGVLAARDYPHYMRSVHRNCESSSPVPILHVVC